MSQTHRHGRDASFDTVLDTFLAISRSYLTCAERVTAINATAARRFVADCARAGDQWTSDSPPTQIAPLTDAFERSLDYSRSVQTALTETHGQVSQMMMREFTALQRRIANPELWRTPFGLSVFESAWPMTAAAAPPAAADTTHADTRSTARKAA